VNDYFKLAGNTVMARGAFEPIETELFRGMLKEFDILVNIGANVGYYCCHALSMGKPVIAFEPMPNNVRYLCENIKSNGWSGAEVYPIALSDHIGILEIYGGGTGSSIIKGWSGTSEVYKTLVPSSTLDTVLGSRLQGMKALIWVDVEGAERWMLEGATSMLGNSPKPMWMVEIMTADHQPHGVRTNPNLKRTFQLFFENGYQAFRFENNMLPVTMKDLDLILDGNQQFSTHNFLFCESREHLFTVASHLGYKHQ